jgi:hypothetical protein
VTAVEVKRFDEPDDTWAFGDKGRSEIVRVRDVMVVRSVLAPGWSWLEHIKPMAEGLESCPLRHREYVVAGRIRYEMAESGDAVEAGAGSYLDIQPGHWASVVGDETCVLVDWDEDWGDG